MRTAITSQTSRDYFNVNQKYNKVADKSHPTTIQQEDA